MIYYLCLIIGYGVNACLNMSFNNRTGKEQYESLSKKW
jgi:hypothetical protein